MSKKEYLALPEQWGLRLDKALALDEEISSRSRAALLIDQNRILINHKAVKSSYQVNEGDFISIDFPPPTPTTLQPYDLKLDVLYEDEALIVINKPSGLVVHPAAGHEQDTLVNALIAHTTELSMKFGEERPGIVHRLDKETSGILVVAKNDLAHENLAAQFKERSTHRIYNAVCLGVPQKSHGKIESFLARHPTDRKKYASVLDRNRKIVTDIANPPHIGKWAATNYQVLKSHHGLSYLKLKLETGRTHQIRVHLSEMGNPIAGDSLYGAEKKLKSVSSKEIAQDLKNLSRFLLHACELSFTHPLSQNRLEFKVDWPASDLELITKWGLLS